MLHPITIMLVYVSIVICTPVIYGIDVDAQNDNEKTEEKYKEFDNYLQTFGLDGESEQYHLKNEVPKPTEEQLDLERRRILATKYLDELESVKQDWIDPYDMGRISLRKTSDKMASKTTVAEATSAPPTTNKKDDSPSTNIKKEELCSSTSVSIQQTVSAPKEQQCVLDSVYITRWLKKILLRIEKESGEEYSVISFPLDTDTLENLRQMASAKTFEVSMLDEVLSNMLAQADIRQKESYFEVAYTYRTDILRGIACVSGVTLFLYVLRRSFLYCPKFTLLCCGIAINIGWHWMHLYQKIKAHKHAELSSMHIPSQCKKHDLGLLEHMAEYFKSFFTTSECGKYYEALLVDPFWEVSLSVATTEAVTATLFQPLFASSRAANYFLKQLFDGLPIYLTVFLIVFIFFVALMKFGYAIKLPLFMGRIEPCHPVGGSRVEELEARTQLPKLTDTILNAVTDTKTTGMKQILKQDSTVGLKETHSQSIEYSSDKDGTVKSIYKQEKQTSSFRSPNSDAVPQQVNETISEEGLAVRSGYFEVLNEGEGPKSIQYPFSDPGINVGSNISDDVTVPLTSSEKAATPAYLKAVSKHDEYTSSVQEKGVLVPKSIQSQSDDSGYLDVKDKMKGLNLTDSFEIIQRDDISSASMHSSCSAGPNCDTSLDILNEMHRGCKFCNSTDSIA